MKRKPRSLKLQAVRLALISLIIITAREYGRLTYDNLWRAQAIVAGMEEKPYAYRALIPWLAQVLVLLGIRADIALLLLVVLSAIGLLYGLKYLLASFRRS